LALTSTPDPNDATRADADEHAPYQDDASQADGLNDAGTGSGGNAGESHHDDAAPGVGEAVGGTRAAFMRMIGAHVALLRAELTIAGQKLGIIIGLALGAIALAMLVGILLYVGTFLFMGDWLFGSMGWGIIHGTLVTGAIIGAIAVDLGGGDVRSYGIGALVGVIVTIVIAALLLSNVGNEAGEAARRWLEDLVNEDAVPFGAEWLTTLSGFVIGAGVVTVIALVAGWRMEWKFGSPLVLGLTGFIVGGFIGAIYASTRYDAPDGVLGLAIMIGLITWMVVGLGLAARKGFEPEARYAGLVPRESIASFETTKDFLMEQWTKQKNRMMGR
jgi:hypothetical protein